MCSADAAGVDDHSRLQLRDRASSAKTCAPGERGVVITCVKHVLGLPKPGLARQCERLYGIVQIGENTGLGMIPTDGCYVCYRARSDALLSCCSRGRARIRLETIRAGSGLLPFRKSSSPQRASFGKQRVEVGLYYFTCLSGELRCLR